jgi:hypothetical protein
MPRERKPTDRYDPSKEAAKPQWAGTKSGTTTKYEEYDFGNGDIVRVYDDNAPTTTFPVFTGKHTLFVDDSDDDEDKGKGVASPCPPPAKKAKYDGKGKGVASPSPPPAKKAKHTRFTYSDDDE